MSIADETVDLVIDLVEYVHKAKYTTFGLRRCHDKIAIGEIAPRSYDWDHVNDVSSSKLLPGTCALQVGDYMSWEQYHDALLESEQYPSNMTYLLGSDRYEYGEDEGEIIMKHAEVLAIL